MGGTDPRSDLYALGATLYTLLTGQVPPESIARAMEIQALTPIQQMCPDVTPTVAHAIEAALQIRPTQRPQSVAEFQDLLFVRIISEKGIEKKTHKHWRIALAAPSTFFKHTSAIPPLVAQILYNRGVTTPDDIDAFLQGKFQPDNPFVMKDIPQAVSLLRKAIMRVIALSSMVIMT